MTLDPSTPTVTLSNGAVAIPLPVVGLPVDQAIRCIQIRLLNPNHVLISTFFEGFTISLTPIF